jgi:transcriptional regulator with XRE-family HTH domain
MSIEPLWRNGRMELVTCAIQLDTRARDLGPHCPGLSGAGCSTASYFSLSALTISPCQLPSYGQAVGPPMKKKLGSTIREFREVRGLTQSELAKLSGLSASQISNIERGEFAPSLEAIEKISRALRLKIPTLFQFDLVPNDRARLDHQLELLALSNDLSAADLSFAIGVVRLISQRSKAARDP